MFATSAARVAARHLDLTLEDYEPLNYWGGSPFLVGTGIGIGSKSDPAMVERLRELGRKVKPRKLKALWRGMFFPEGTLFHDGFEQVQNPGSNGVTIKQWSSNPRPSYPYEQVKAPDGWVNATDLVSAERSHPGRSAPWYRDDVDLYRPYIRGVRSWATSFRDAQHYARGGYSGGNRPSGDGLILEWLNPSPASIVVDTKPITDAGYKVTTDTGEVIADATGSTLVGVRYEKGWLILTLTG